MFIPLLLESKYGRSVTFCQVKIDLPFNVAIISDMEKQLQRAIKMLGGGVALATLLGIERQAVWQWKICPVKRVLMIEELTDGKVTRYQLRPDIYGKKVK